MKKIIAIIREDAWEETVENLENAGVDGASISIVKGYGEYLNPYRKDGLDAHAQIIIFAQDEDVDKIANNIMESAHTGLQGDGIISVLPVEQFYRIRSKSKISDMQ